MEYSNNTTIDTYSFSKNNTKMETSENFNNASFSSLFANKTKVIRGLASNILNLVRKESPTLYWIVMLNFLAAVIVVPAMLIDDRTLMGISVWLKPLKFLISTGIYIFTIGYMTTLYPYSSRKKSIINNTVAWTLLIEMIIVVVQGARGVQSHYNMSNPVDGILYGMMGILIGINVLIMILFIIDTLRYKMKTSKSIQWAILLGWVVIVAGSWVGGQMIGQLSHTVGAADGGEGIPFLNWSTIAGDLRVAHFFGLHGIQILPLFALWISNQWNTTTRNKILVVTTFALIYAGWIAFTYFQAQQGIALLSM